ncbi:hypothetical protein [Polymorphospora sp. NPDC050346]|uniref:hypothetical protein n=1 Tax=Polymorphospora sp. NPDC050346 TaxID=3155780 RepID=UPI0033EF7E8A
MPKKVKHLLACVTLSVLTAVGLGSPPAYAEPIPRTAGEASLLATCYGGAVRSKFSIGAWGGEVGTYRTTNRCVDVNIRNFSTYGTNACVIFVNATSGCNYWTYIPAKSGWFTVATNVRDGVPFRVRLSNNFYQYTPLEVQVAF